LLPQADAKAACGRIVIPRAAALTVERWPSEFLRVWRGKRISSSDIDNARVAHSVLPQADAKAACGRIVIPRAAALTVRHLDTAEHQPPPVTNTYSTSAADSDPLTLSNHRTISYECAAKSKS